MALEAHTKTGDLECAHIFRQGFRDLDFNWKLSTMLVRFLQSYCYGSWRFATEGEFCRTVFWIIVVFKVFHDHSLCLLSFSRVFRLAYLRHNSFHK